MMLRYPAGGGWLLWRPPEAGPETATWRRRWSTKRGKHTSTPRWVDRLRSFFHLSVFISGFPWGSWAWAKGSRSRWMSNDSRWCGGHQCVVNSLGSYRGLARWDEPRGRRRMMIQLLFQKRPVSALKRFILPKSLVWTSPRNPWCIPDAFSPV